MSLVKVTGNAGRAGAWPLTTGAKTTMASANAAASRSARSMNPPPLRGSESGQCSTRVIHAVVYADGNQPRSARLRKLLRNNGYGVGIYIIDWHLNCCSTAPEGCHGYGRHGT